jgi:hypothetical protein
MNIEQDNARAQVIEYAIGIAAQRVVAAGTVETRLAGACRRRR